MTKLLKYMIAMVAVLLAMVMFVGFTSGGIDRQITAQAEAELTKVANAANSVKSNQNQVAQLVKADPDLFAPREISAANFEPILERLKQTNDKGGKDSHAFKSE